ncbi:hypothetical protein LCGC14_0704620 [marine sediment metagenome]|uniref:Helicase C-terminal domain-containing protein n=1 Tax=marine sediment metagenome TaxID=412755 RepID=A0A0F9QGY5_9ZZZZ
MAYLTIKDKKLALKVPPVQRYTALSILGRKFDRSTKMWLYPFEKYDEIVERFSELEIDICVADAIRENQDKLNFLFNLKQNLIEGKTKWTDKYPQALAVKELLDHQKFSIGFFSQIPDGLCSDFSETGTGKTLVQIMLIKSRTLFQGVQNILIFCPKSIIHTVWKKELKKWYPDINVVTIDDTNIPTNDLIPPTVWVVNYEKSWRMETFLTSLNAEMIILDESTRIKNPIAKRTKAIHRIPKSSKFRSIMTGVPTPNSLLDIYSQLKFLTPDIFGTFTQFKYEHFNYIPHTFSWVPKKGTAAKIKKLMDLHGVSHLKKDCLDLPKLTVQDMYCELDKETRKVYNDLVKEMIAYFENTTYLAQIAITKILRLSQITSGFIQNTGEVGLTEFKSQPKFVLLCELIKDIPKDHKIVIWAVFRHDIQMLETTFTNSAVSIHGGINAKDREIAVDRFQNDDSIRYFIGHPASAGHGITLTAANYAIYYSLNYSYENYQQSMDRINRISQIKPMTVYRLLARHTVDLVICNALEKKQNLNDFLKNLKESF